MKNVERNEAINLFAQMQSIESKKCWKIAHDTDHHIHVDYKRNWISFCVYSFSFIRVCACARFG